MEAQFEGTGRDGASPPEIGAALVGEDVAVGQEEILLRDVGDAPAVVVDEDLDSTAAESVAGTVAVVPLRE